MLYNSVSGNIFVSSRQFSITADRDIKQLLICSYTDYHLTLKILEHDTVNTMSFVFFWQITNVNIFSSVNRGDGSSPPQPILYLSVPFKVLFGVLLCVDKHSQFFGMPQRPGRGPQDQHNVMPIAVNPVRFTLLPLSSHRVEPTETEKSKVNLS